MEKPLISNLSKIEDKAHKTVKIGKYKYSISKFYAYSVNPKTFNLILHVAYRVTKWEPKEINFFYCDVAKDDIQQEELIIWGDNIPKNSWGKALLELLKD